MIAFNPNSFVSPAKTENAKLGPTATAEVRNYYATATAQARQQAAPTPAPVTITSGGGSTGNNGVTGGRSGCGSRGGPGHRLPNGKCASWRDVR